MDKDFLLRAYGGLYGPEAGPWNLSAEQKYLEYRITAFFEESFPVAHGARLCNVGIGAGCWDRYLSYRLNGGSLTSIDIDGQICRQLREGLENEGNPNPVAVVAKDVMDCGEFAGQFDIVTMVGSTLKEAGRHREVLEQLFRFLKPGGCLYYQSLDPAQTREETEGLCAENHMRVERFLAEKCYGREACYWKIVKLKS